MSITDQQGDYAREVQAELREAGIRADLDDRNEKIGYKIREWETKKVPYMLVLGEKERSAGTVSVRRHRKGDIGAVTRAEFIRSATNEIDEKQATT